MRTAAWKFTRAPGLETAESHDATLVEGAGDCHNAAREGTAGGRPDLGA
jgi:hypothetical protein